MIRTTEKLRPSVLTNLQQSQLFLLNNLEATKSTPIKEEKKEHPK
jgi:hypothetical protein